MLLGMEYGTPAILRPTYGPLCDGTLCWFGWFEVPLATRLRLDYGIARKARLAPWAVLDNDDPVRRQIGGFDFPDIPDEHEAGYDRRA